MITSFFDGRVRIKDEALRDENNMSMVTALMANHDGITKITPNVRTGSLLVEYDPEKIPRETLLEAGAMLEKQFAEARAKTKKKTASGKRNSRISHLSPLEESVILGGLFALTAVTGYTSKSLHVALGLAFAVLAGVHVYDRKRCLTGNKSC